MIRLLVFFLIILLPIALLSQDVQPTIHGSVRQAAPDSALIILKKDYNKALEKKDEFAEGTALQKMGQLCYNQGHYAQALNFYQRADHIFSVLNNPDALAANLADMGILYYYNKQIKRSREYYNKALAIYIRNKNLKGIAGVLGNVGHLYEKTHRYDSAFYYQHWALSTYTRANNRQGVAKIYENLGSIYEDLARYDSAYVSFKHSLQLYNEDNDETGSIEVINNLGDILRKTGKYKESLTESRRAMTIAARSGNIYQLASSAKDIGQAYELLRQPDSAYHYSELSRRYYLDVYSKESVSQTAFLQVLYDMDQKSNEIARLNNARNVNRVIGVSVAIVCVLLVILAMVIISRQRLKIKDQLAYSREKDALHEMTQLELENRRLQQNNLNQQLQVKTKELSTHTLNLIRNNQLLEHLRSTLQAMVKEDKRDQKKQMQQIILQINESFSHEQHWKEFTVAFEQVHQSFFEKLKNYSTDLTSTDMRLIAMLKINLNSADIATLLGISTDSLRVSRYRLRKKLNIKQGENLTAFIQGL